MTRHKVLVVEDEPVLALDIASTLDSLGCDMVGPVARLSDALSVVATETFDCAILDVNLRGECITPVADILLDRHVPLLLSTGYSDLALPKQLVSQPRLAKPYTSDQLECALRLLCSQAASTRYREH
jgi:CheY-like chemotaxis protein